MSNFIIPTLLLIDGTAFALAAVFAQAIGLDPSIGWGRSRFILLFFGIILIFFSLLLIRSQKGLNNFFCFSMA